MAAPTALLSLLIALVSIVIADPPAFSNSTAYDNGELGIYIDTPFKTTSIKAPQVNFLLWPPECSHEDEFFFLAPRGMLVAMPGPVILDNDGHIIWHREDFGVAYGLEVQELRGQKVLTFWSGDDMVVGHGQGYHYIFDDTYQQLHRVSAVGEGLLADLHEFQITADGTALLTIYNKTRADLKAPYGDAFPTDGWVYDCLFQEIDLETNALLFQWRASDYFTFDDCFNSPNADVGDGLSDRLAFDWFHINSIDKTAAGDYLISARYSHALTLIDGHTGDIRWHLGGRNNSFNDLSDGRASNFKWQHDARWQHNETAVSVFDNAAYFGDKTDPARGLLIDLDTSAMTATLRTEWAHPEGYISESQGSLQVFEDDGSALLGYGAAPTFSLFDAAGTLMCDAAFGALHWREGHEFSPGAVMSYRVRRHAWIGQPAESPRVAFADGAFLVSWNGDTRAREWTLEGAQDAHAADAALQGHDDARGWTTLCTLARQGFESACSLPPDAAGGASHLAFRLSARDAAGALLGTWRVDGAGAVVALSAQSTSSASPSSPSIISPSSPPTTTPQAADTIIDTTPPSTLTDAGTPSARPRKGLSPLFLAACCLASAALGYLFASRRQAWRAQRQRGRGFSSGSAGADAADGMLLRPLRTAGLTGGADVDDVEKTPRTGGSGDFAGGEDAGRGEWDWDGDDDGAENVASPLLVGGLAGTGAGAAAGDADAEDDARLRKRA